MAKRPVLVPWDVQPFEAGVIADEYLGGLSTVIDGGQVAFNRYVAAVGTGYNVKGTRSNSRSGRGFLGSASSIITAETTAFAAAPIFEIAGGDWTFQIVIDGIGGAGTNPGFWRSGTTYADAYFFIQNAATRRPWIRINGVDVLKPASGAQWTTGQRINLVARLKSASSADVWWDGKKQHTATHSTAQPALTATQAIHGLMLQSDTGQYTSGNAVAIRFWNRYLSDAAVARINEDELALYQPRSVFVSLSAGGASNFSGGSQSTVSVTNVGAGTAREVAAGGSASSVAVSSAGTGTARETAAGGSSSSISVTNAGAGTARELASGGAASIVAVTNVGAGTARETAAGGSSSTVAVSNAGAGVAREVAVGGAASLVAVTSVGSGSAQEEGSASGGSSSVVSVSNSGAGVAVERASGGSSSKVAVGSVGAGLALEIVVGGSAAPVAVTSVGGGVANTGSSNDFAGGSSSPIAVTSAGAGLALEIVVGGSSSVVSVSSVGFGFQPQDEAPPLDIFARMSAMVVKTFGKPSYLNGSPTPVKINIEHDVQLAGMGSEQAAYRGDYVANRDIATIETTLNPQIGDRFVQDGIQYRLEMLVKDNGVNRRFVISRVRT